MKISNKKKDYIYNMSIKHCIPEELLLGIFILETTYRKWYHRTIENLFVIASILAHILFLRSVKNYTIGCCQIGLANLLISFDRPRYRHSLKLDDLTYVDLVIIIKGMFYRNNIQSCANLTEVLYNREISRGSSKDIIIRRVGEEYNGKYTYGLMLENICSDINRY